MDSDVGEGAPRLTVGRRTWTGPQDSSPARTACPAKLPALGAEAPVAVDEVLALPGRAVVSCVCSAAACGPGVALALFAGEEVVCGFDPDADLSLGVVASSAAS